MQSTVFGFSAPTTAGTKKTSVLYDVNLKSNFGMKEVNAGYKYSEVDCADSLPLVITQRCKEIRPTFSISSQFQDSSVVTRRFETIIEAMAKTTDDATDMRVDTPIRCNIQIDVPANGLITADMKREIVDIAYSTLKTTENLDLVDKFTKDLIYLDADI